MPNSLPLLDFQSSARSDDDTICSFGHERVARTRRDHHTAPAGPACLNNNALHRRGRPNLLTSAPRMSAPARPPCMEASRS